MLHQTVLANRCSEWYARKLERQSSVSMTQYPPLCTNCQAPNNVLSQAWMPSIHVWSTCVSPTSPQFLNQAPPRAQQLRLPNFLTVPHLGQAELTIVEVDLESGRILLPDRTGFEHGLMIQRRDHKSNTSWISQSPYAIAAHGTISGVSIAVGVLAEATAERRSNYESWNSAWPCKSSCRQAQDRT